MAAAQLDNLAWLAGTSAVLVGGSYLLRARIARTGSGRIAQLRFRSLHGNRVVELLGGRLDPRRGSPWIDTYLDGRAVQLLAAPLDGRMQAGVLLLDHHLPVNVWHTSGDPDELEAPPGTDLDELAAITAMLRATEVDSVACGTRIDSDPRPPHIVRVRFDDVEQLRDHLGRIAPLLERLEQLAPS